MNDDKSFSLIEDDIDVDDIQRKYYQYVMQDHGKNNKLVYSNNVIKTDETNFYLDEECSVPYVKDGVFQRGDNNTNYDRYSPYYYHGTNTSIDEKIYVIHDKKQFDYENLIYYKFNGNVDNPKFTKINTTIKQDDVTKEYRYNLVCLKTENKVVYEHNYAPLYTQSQSIKPHTWPNTKKVFGTTTYKQYFYNDEQCSNEISEDSIDIVNYNSSTYTNYTMYSKFKYIGKNENIPEYVYVKHDFLPVKHMFEKKGTYKVKLVGTCDNLWGWDYKKAPNGGNKTSNAIQKHLVSVQVPKDSTSPLKYAYGSFFGCEKLTNIGYGVLHNIIPCKEVPHLYDGAIIKEIQPWMLYGGDNLESIEYTFENCKMESIDKDVFKYCKNVYNADHCFHRCSNLIEIPLGLFDNMTKLETVNILFRSCINLSKIPRKLFKNNPNLKSCYRCFAGDGSDGDIDPLSNRFDAESYHKNKIPTDNDAYYGIPNLYDINSDDNSLRYEIKSMFHPKAKPESGDDFDTTSSYPKPDGTGIYLYTYKWYSVDRSNSSTIDTTYIKWFF